MTHRPRPLHRRHYSPPSTILAAAEENGLPSPPSAGRPIATKPPMRRRMTPPMEHIPSVARCVSSKVAVGAGRTRPPSRPLPSSRGLKPPEPLPSAPPPPSPFTAAAVAAAAFATRSQDPAPASSPFSARRGGLLTRSATAAAVGRATSRAGSRRGTILFSCACRFRLRCLRLSQTPGPPRRTPRSDTTAIRERGGCAAGDGGSSRCAPSSRAAHHCRRWPAVKLPRRRLTRRGCFYRRPTRASFGGATSSGSIERSNTTEMGATRPAN